MNAYTKIHNATLLAASLALLITAVPAHAESSAHIFWAEDVATHITPANNAYGTSPNFVHWPGVDGATAYENRTECSTFVTRVLKQAYGWGDAYFRTWMSSTSPSAAKYHDAILAQNGFNLVSDIAAIQAGDIIAIKYPEGFSPSGHAMIALGAAQPRARNTAPIVVGTTQYEIEIVDSSKSGHGPTDTRLMSDDSWDDGVGIGILRLYADGNGTIVGHTWSTYKNSTYYGPNTRHLVVGRLP